MYMVQNGKLRKLSIKNGRLCYTVDDKYVWYVDGLDVPIYTESEMLEKYPELMI